MLFSCGKLQEIPPYLRTLNQILYLITFICLDFIATVCVFRIQKPSRKRKIIKLIKFDIFTLRERNFLLFFCFDFLLLFVCFVCWVFEIFK